jgi:hypothetical protein
VHLTGRVAQQFRMSATSYGVGKWLFAYTCTSAESTAVLLQPLELVLRAKKLLGVWNIAGLNQ